MFMILNYFHWFPHEMYFLQHFTFSYFYIQLLMFMILNYFHWFPHEMYFFTVYTCILCINIKKNIPKRY
jgi:hypothetical protein